MDLRERDFPVRGIAEPARVETRETHQDAIAEFEARNFTYVPLPKTNEYYHVKEGWIQELWDGQWIEPDAHLFDGLERLCEVPFLLVDYREEGTDEAVRAGAADAEYGIVTVADVNKRGTHEMIYPVLAELSALIARRIESRYESRELFDKVSDRTVGAWIKDQADDVELHIAESMDLGEMHEVLAKTNERLANSCGFESKSELEDLDRIRSLRNRVMHANRSLVRERREIDELLETVGRAQELIRKANTGEAFGRPD